MNKITLGIVAAVFSASANADWTFTDLHSLPLGRSAALAINNSNQIVGQTNIGGGIVGNAAMWENGNEIHIFANSNNFHSIATDINNSGQIAVFKAPRLGSDYETFILKNGVYTELQYPNDIPRYKPILDINNNGELIAQSGWRYGSNFDIYWDAQGNSQFLNKSLYGLNDNGQIVGQAVFNGEVHAALFEGNKTTDLGMGFPWATSATAVDINNAGQILAIGFGATTGQRSFLIDGDIIRSLKSTGERSEGVALNEHGIVVGHQYLDISPKSPHYAFMQTEAVIWDGHNQFKLNDFLDQDLKDAGWVLVTANDINDNGWVVGEAYNMITGVTHAYSFSTDEMLSPIPEPSTYLMLLAGLGLLGFVGRRKIQDNSQLDRI